MNAWGVFVVPEHWLGTSFKSLSRIQSRCLITDRYIDGSRAVGRVSLSYSGRLGKGS